ncbi:MAG: zinc ribbon domain-containing protein [Blastocatellia bacterium]
MNLNNNEAPVRADSTAELASSEIDLYAELAAFVELSPEDQLRHADRFALESIEAAEQSEPTSAQEDSFEDVKAHIPDNSVETVSVSDDSSEPAELEEVATSTEMAGTESVSENLQEADEPSPQRFEVFGRSGPLGRLSPDLLFTGALSRGVCLACGAESGVDDLFCLTCGVFIDEIASTLPPKPSCAECGQEVTADEIFCPWCGSVSPA